VLRDPSVLDPDIRNISKPKTTTPKACSATPRPAEEAGAEMRGRIKEDDSSVPAPDGPFAYLRKFREGGQHEMFGRTPRDGGEVEIVLDGDALAADHEYFKFGGARHSPDHRLEAWSADIKGSEYFRSACATGPTGADLDDLVEETDGGVVWSTDCKSFFYVKLDDNHRPMQVWRHRLGTPQADDIRWSMKKQDSGWFTHIHESSSGRFCVIAGGDHETSEQRLIDLANPDAPPRLVAAREEPACNIRSPTAATSCSFSPMPTARSTSRSSPRRSQSPERANWRDLIPHREGVYVSMSSSMPATWCGWSAPTRCRDRHPRSQIRRGARHRLRRGGLFARHHGRL
jgi:oligopeptidase B